MSANPKVAFSDAEASKKLESLSDWDLGKNAIHGEFSFKNYAMALEFVNRISVLAEEVMHHPDINFGWGYCDITLTTHDAEGLTQKDFDLAEKISSILA